MANTSILNIIIGKFCHKKKPCPIILFKIDKSSKVDFYHTILPSGLIIYLWVKRDGESSFDTKEIA